MSQLSMRTAEVIAIEINSIKDQTRKLILSGSIEIGRRLAEAKAMLQHGEWGNWLADSVDYSQSTATNLMKIFENYGADQLTLFGDNANSEALANLSYTQAVALLGVPTEEREQFVVETGAAEMSTRELQAAVKERAQAIKEKEVAEKAAEKERKTREKLELQQKDHESIVQRLNEQIKQVQDTAYADSSDADDQTAAVLQADLDKSKAELMESQVKIKQLETELKAKPIDIPAIVEKVPDDILKELKDLRKKVATGTGEEAAVFKATFKTLTDTFKHLLSALDVVKGVDPELHERYKGAVSTTLTKMHDAL
ncbi:DUF3102 domain-containing protein [Paenibacillus sp. 19GGS1-52]|uniref:DUF3102 domain-containing protein n=1 Tax=Paenibacillus sp. 19GGS1-52 TaxID=2758563 RepID=UPI001EFBA380|nr:DUF3102 domain-containing protein [Paenibacillus sp. 19GGS1-52]ULO08917.1 DUF3102 domain-containing protein [Paenibacillus sp. 19GGS1-52]